MKRIFLILGCLFFLFPFALSYLNDGFSLHKIQSEYADAPQWEIRNPPQEEVAALLDQHFYYIGKGSQCYVFESEDKQFILKFFRQDRYRLPKVTKLFTCPTFLNDIQQKKREIKERKRDALFQSCKIAYEELKEETGLIYLHLNKSDDLPKVVVLHDKLKRAHSIKIGDYAFILQKHGEHIFPYLTRLIKKGKKREAKEALDSLVVLLVSRLQKGIVDHDAVIHKNSGFKNNQALFLDIGEFEKQLCSNPYKEIVSETHDLHLWLRRKDQELATYLEGAIEKSQTFDKHCK